MNDAEAKKKFETEMGVILKSMQAAEEALNLCAATIKAQDAEIARLKEALAAPLAQPQEEIDERAEFKKWWEDNFRKSTIHGNSAYGKCWVAWQARAALNGGKP